MVGCRELDLATPSIPQTLNAQMTESVGSEALPEQLFSACDDTERAFINDAWLSAQWVTVALIDGKQIGVLAAARNLAAGECLLQEEPLLKLTPDGAGRYDGTYAFGDRERARGLLRTLSAAKSGAGDLGGVIETNGIVVNHGQTSAFTVVQLMISRCNHSCAPNAAFSWDDELMVGRLITKHPIPAGTEVTINYGAKGNREMRQQFLFDRFNFECACPLCDLDHA